MAITIAAGVRSAEAQSCGEVLTTNTTLTADLLNCPDNGLVIGADGIVVDLGGHTVDGVGLAVGIRNDGFANVTIKNGTIQEFDYGVQLNETAYNTVDWLTLTLNQDAGIQLNNAHRNTIRNNTVINSGDSAVIVNTSSFNLFEKNTVSVTGDSAVIFNNSNDNTLKGNTVSNTGDKAVVFNTSSHNMFTENCLSATGDTALLLQAGSDENKVVSNTFTGASDQGVWAIDSNTNSFESNNKSNKCNDAETTQDPGDAVFKLTRAHMNKIQNNIARSHNDCGIFLEFSDKNEIMDNIASGGPCGIELAHSNENVVQSNKANETTGIGIILEDSLANKVVGNTASANNAQGIYVVGEAAETAEGESDGGNLIDGNTANDNRGDGIVVAGRGHTISNNTANQNAGWGIYAGPGNVDGEGNFAKGNTEPTQCFGTFCEEEPLTCPKTGEPLVAVAVSAADSWIAQDHGGSNFGTDSTLKVRSKSPANDYSALVRFRLPKKPEGCGVESAKLRLYAASYTTGRTIQVLGVATEWTESGVTWDTPLAITGVLDETSSDPDPEKTLEWDVTAFVQAMYGGDANNGFLIRDRDPGDVASPEQSFHSREKTPDRPPALVIEFKRTAP